MLRKFALVGSAALAAVGAFIGVSQARTAAQPSIPPTLSASGLAPATLSSDQQVALLNIIGDNAAVFGISAGSLDDTVQIASTSVGPLYAVPGTVGVCLVLGNNSSCGSPNSSAPVVAIFTHGASGNVVGGGVYDRSVSHITVGRAGSTTTAQNVTGGFIVSETAGIPANSPDLSLTATK